MLDNTAKEHKSGFVNIIGNPNVGKSTLMNALVGERLSIITSKSQTTRHRILGIVNGADFQILYSDTPGIINPAYKMQESMMKHVSTALSDADIILYVTDVVETVGKSDDYLKKIADTDVPVIVLMNKTDLTTDVDLQILREQWKELLPNAEYMEISALQFTNIDKLLLRILELLPLGPAYYPKDQLTDKPERFFVSEIIREKILKCYRKEIPYSVEIVVESFEESEKIIRIRAVIYVERDTQKGIIIGHQGKALKNTGMLARQDIEKFLGKQVYLELFVKVDKDWRESDRKLRAFGYLD
jgi:GTP-binding protein Era